MDLHTTIAAVAAALKELTGGLEDYDDDDDFDEDIYNRWIHVLIDCGQEGAEHLLMSDIQRDVRDARHQIKATIAYLDTLLGANAGPKTLRLVDKD